MEAYREDIPASLDVKMERFRRTVAAGCAWCDRPFYEDDTYGEDGGRILMGGRTWRYYCSRDCIMQAAGLQ